MNQPVVPGRILVVEDEPSIADIVSTALRHEGHTVVHLEHGEAALELATDCAFDALILDVQLPGLDGFELCARLRQRGVVVPVLFLTAREDSVDRIRGFVVGGDDYLTKPFNIDELVLRVAAILRRSRPTTTRVLQVADLSLDVDAQQVRRGGILVDLSHTEFRLLHYLMINSGIVLSKAKILLSVWGDDFDGTENVVEIYVGYIRRKIDLDRIPLIHTRRGAGYVLRHDTQT